MVIMGTVATQLFGGFLLKRCYYIQREFDSENYFLEKWENDDADHYCTFDKHCPKNTYCLSGPGSGNPAFGVIGFDNIMKSILNIFVIITLEGWTDIMFMIREAGGGVYYDCFFVLCVIFGAFFVLNLMIAVQFSSLETSMDAPKSKTEGQKEGDNTSEQDDDEDDDDESESQESNAGPNTGEPNNFTKAVAKKNKTKKEKKPDAGSDSEEHPKEEPKCRQPKCLLDSRESVRKQLD